MEAAEQAHAILTGIDSGVGSPIPLCIYNWMIHDYTDVRWRRLFDQGLVPIEHCDTALRRFPEGAHRRNSSTAGGSTYTQFSWETPVGVVSESYTDGWRTEHFIKKPKDYEVFTWLFEHCTIQPDYRQYELAIQQAGNGGLPVVGMWYHRSPLMEIQIDIAGTEQFCFDIALEQPELLELYDVMRNLHWRWVETVARGPGDIVKLFENLTAGILGPNRFNQYLMPVYTEDADLLHRSGKHLSVHYDGDLSAVKDLIASAPFDIIESLTEPPEGDMTYAECREMWPEKILWGNINLDVFSLEEAQLRDSVIAKADQCMGNLVFEISEDLPDNWELSLPIVLDALGWEV